MPEIFQIAVRVTVMRDGKIVLSEQVSSTTEAQVIEAMIGRELDNFVKPQKEVSQEALLSISAVSKPRAFADISFDVHKGEIVALTGLRGCGGARLIKSIFGLDADYTGEVRFRDKGLLPDVILRQRLKMVWGW